MGEYFKKRLNELAEAHLQNGDVRGMGLLIGVELVKDQENREPAPQMASTVVGAALKRGLMIGAIGTYRKTLRLTPPLVLTERESDIAFEIIDESLKEAGKKRDASHSLDESHVPLLLPKVHEGRGAH